MSFLRLFSRTPPVVAADPEPTVITFKADDNLMTRADNIWRALGFASDRLGMVPRIAGYLSMYRDWDRARRATAVAGQNGRPMVTRINAGAGDSGERDDGLPEMERFVSTAATPSIEQTIELITALHAGQHDWCGEDYSKHVVAVMGMLDPIATQDDRHIALLHDVIEDCKPAIASRLGVDISRLDFDGCVQFLRDLGYSDYTVEGVVLVTRETDGRYFDAMLKMLVRGSYMDYVHNIIASGHVGAILTKLADNEHNTAPERAEGLPPELRQIAHNMAAGRYARSKAALRAALDKVRADRLVED